MNLELKNKIAHLSAGIILLLGLLAIAFIASLLSSKLICWGTASGWGVATILILIWDVGFISRHFDGEKWV